MNTTSHLALTGEALRLRLVELLAPTCGMETPATARAAYDFVVGEIHHGAAPRVEIRVDHPAPGGGVEPLTRPGWPPAPVEAEPEPKPVIPTVSWSAETLIQLERLYASGLPQTAIAAQFKLAPHHLRKALSASTGIKARWPRNAAGIPAHPPYPLDAPWPPPADWDSAGEKAPRSAKEKSPAPPKQQEAKPRVKTEGSVTAKQVDQIIDKLHKPVLPEDRLRRADDPVLCPCDIETVENWMEGQGLKLTFEGAGIYTCEGSPMTAAQLVKRANRARKAVSLPAFDVRGI